MRIGGAEQVIFNLVDHTDKQMFEIDILCLEDVIGPLGEMIADRGVAVSTLGRKPGFDLTLILKIRKHIINKKIEILHCHQYTPYIYGVLASIFTPCDVIFTEHGRFYPDTRKLKRIIVNPLLSLITKKITAISSATVDALVKYENFSRKDIELVYNGLDDSKYNDRVHEDSNKNLLLQYGIKSSAFVLGTVARLDPIKNQPLMLHALKKVLNRYPDTFLLIVGDGPERDTLQNLSDDLGITERVIFTGFRNDAYKFYNIMDIFLLTSFSEGAAMTLIESMASSLPCIVTDVGGNPEIVIDQQTGFVISSGDLEQLVSSICELIENPDKREKMGKAGRLNYEEHYTIDKMVNSYQCIYLE